ARPGAAFSVVIGRFSMPPFARVARCSCNGAPQPAHAAAPATDGEFLPMSTTDLASERITFDDFLKVDIRVGTIVELAPFPEARKPAFRLVLDFGGELGRRKSSAQITQSHGPEDLVGRQVLAVVNFPPRQIGPFMSEVLTLGLPDAAGNVMLIGPDRPVPNGGRLY